MAILASRGHFGIDRWQAPTVGGFVFLFWQLGLAPSMCALADDAHRVCTFDTDAVLWGRGIHLMWFVLYALILGEAPREQPPKGAELNARGLFAVQCILVIAFWGIGAFAALQTNSLSLWSGTRHQERDGVLPSLALLYASLTLVPGSTP